MTDVMFFSHHNTGPWWQYLADSLNFTKSVCLVSDLRGEGDICIVDDFYANLREKDCAQIALQHFSPALCDDIIRRCRVLRNQQKAQALAMIGAMWLTFDALIKKEKPKLLITFIIDRYVLDVLNRVLQSYNIPFLGLTASIVPDHVMFMVRGKLIHLREPEMQEIEKARKQLVNDSFTPSYVNNSKKFGRLQYWRTFLYFKLRGAAFELIRHLKRDKLNLHYLEALNRLDHKPRWPDYKVLNLLHEDWEKRLAEVAPDKRVFLALQLLPEASLDYWLDDLALLNNEQVVEEISKVLGQAGYTVFVKDHPLQFGFRKREVMQRLAKLPYVVLVPYAAPATHLIKECPITVTFTGTIGFQSALAGACSIVSGAYYSDEQHFVHFHNLHDITLLPQKIAAFQKDKPQKISDAAIDSLLTNLLSASAPGDLFSFRRFDRNQPQHVEKAATLVESLNKYLPQFLVARKESEIKEPCSV
ncbi:MULTISPECIES: hypothetical protein [unclassified Legionella]|uniref:hypothetical protein n=1 Tax=unclassified Legionella TaxID=2622702 RepID=UPI001E621396|nr:hypothetical protein [Legionella sp. 31fI33]MCC5015555.1 hypothetical protein [Legionella sp. 31fI33]